MIEEAIRSLREDPAFMRCVTHWEQLPARDGVYRDFPPEIDDRILAALRRKGIERLFSHQEAVYREVREKRNVVVVTTKALSQDQQSELNEILLASELPLRIFTYDGDTPRSIRLSVREEGRVVITNPDMLHTGILPNHPKWIKFFKTLEYVVIDEIHTYRGVFGSHMTNLVRRLKRVAAFYGASPVFICCSATIGNPLELAQKIIEEPVALIDDNGAPSGERHFVLYNPPLLTQCRVNARGLWGNPSP